MQAKASHPSRGAVSSSHAMPKIFSGSRSPSNPSADLYLDNLGIEVRCLKVYIPSVSLLSKVLVCEAERKCTLIENEASADNFLSSRSTFTSLPSPCS